MGGVDRISLKTKGPRSRLDVVRAAREEYHMYGKHGELLAVVDADATEEKDRKEIEEEHVVRWTAPLFLQ